MKNTSYSIYLSTIAMSNTPMKWYRFLVEFLLIVTAIVGIFLNALIVVKDLFMYYENSLSQYFTNSLFGFLNIFSFFLIFFNFVMLLIIRSSLKAFDCKTMRYLLMFAITNIAYSFIHLIFTISFAVEENIVVNIFLQLIVSIIFFTFNFIYFKKRKHLFSYDYTQAYKQHSYLHSQRSKPLQENTNNEYDDDSFSVKSEQPKETPFSRKGYPTELSVDSLTQPKEILHIKQIPNITSDINAQNLLNNEKTLHNKSFFIPVIVIITIATLVVSNLFIAFWAGNVKNENNMLHLQLDTMQSNAKSIKTEIEQYKEKIIVDEKIIVNLQQIVEDKAFVNDYLEVYQSSFAFSNEIGSSYHKYECNLLNKFKTIYAVVIYDSDFVACPVCYGD